MTQPLGPRMYYSLFGIRGLALGAKEKLLRTPVTITVEAPGIRHPVSLRVRTTDVALCREILLNGLYDCQLRESPEVIFDLGANIGLSTVYYANKFPTAKIIAVEPDPSNFALLEKNCEPYRNVTLVQGAVWKAAGSVRLFDSGR